MFKNKFNTLSHLTMTRINIKYVKREVKKNAPYRGLLKLNYMTSEGHNWLIIKAELAIKG